MRPKFLLRIKGSSSRFGLTPFYLKLLALTLISLLLLSLPIAGTHPPIQPIGTLAREFYDYITFVVPLYDVSLNKNIYLSILLAIGVFSMVLFKAGRGSLVLSPFSGVELILISIPVLIYIFISFNKPLTQSIAYIFISIGLAVGFTFLQGNEKFRLVVKKLKMQVFFAIISALLLVPFFMHFGHVPVLEPVDFIFNIDFHLTALIGPAVRRIDGYPWFHGAEPTYGLLMPVLTSLMFSQSTFTIEKSMAYLQFLQAMLVVLMVIAMFFRSKNFTHLVFVLPTLYFFHPASLLTLVPNHSAWRYMGVAFVFFALSLVCLKRKRLHPVLKGGVGAISVLANFETGLFILAGLIGSEILTQRGQFQRALITAGSAILLILAFVFLITGLAPGEYYYKIYNNLTLNGSIGGEPYNAIPAFAVIVLHCALIVWRTAQSKIRVPHQDFDFVVSIFCLGWSIYFVNRPNTTYLAVIFIVYSFVIMRLLRDVQWMVGYKKKMLSYGFVFICTFSYFSLFINYLDNFYLRMNVRFLEVVHIREMEALSTVNSAALELSRSAGATDGYITPFSFFVRGISELPNNLTTLDPFFLITENELTSFFSSGSLPKVIFLPRLEKFFYPVPPPVSYIHFIDRIIFLLKAREYTEQQELQYWTVFRYMDR
jgi:hypothetical protein